MKSKADRDIELIKKVIVTTPIENKKYIKTIDVVRDKFTDDQYIVKIKFQHGMLSDSERDNLIDDIWKTVYDYTGIPTGFVNLNKFESETITESEDKTIKILHNFMETFDLPNICGYWIDEEEDIHGKYWVYIILDLDFIGNTTPGMVAKIYREKLKKEIKKFTNIDVEIGTTSRKCD